MGNQLEEAEGHIHPGFGRTEQRTIEVSQKRQMHFAITPVIAELVRGDGHRRESARRFGLEETKALGQLRRNEVTQAHVVDQHQQFDVTGGPLRAYPHRHIIGDDGHLRLEIDPPLLRSHDNRPTGSQKAVGAPLIHQRIVPEALRHLGAAGLAHQLHMVDVGAAISPLVGARQRREARRFVKGKRVGHTALVKLLIDSLKPGGNLGPLVEGGLQRRGNLSHPHRPGQIPAHHHQSAIALAIVQCCQFHKRFLICRQQRPGAASWRHTGCSRSLHTGCRCSAHRGCRASPLPRR